MPARVCRPGCRTGCCRLLLSGVLDYECREDLSSNAFGLEHMAAEITAAERDTAADLVQRRDQPTEVASEEADAPAVHKKDMIKEADEYFIKFHDLKVWLEWNAAEELLG